MEQYLIHMNILRQVMPAEVTHILVNVDQSKGDQIWLVGTRGSRRMVTDLKAYTPDQWTRYAQAGLVFVLWSQQWAFAPELDENTKLPLLMQRFEDAFLQQAADQGPAKAHDQQLSLMEKPAAATATTPQTT